jgi:hypothetical protein
MIFTPGICKALIVMDASKQLKCSEVVFLPITGSQQRNKVVCKIGWFDLKYQLRIGMKGMLLPGFAIVMFYCEHRVFTFHRNLLGGPKVHLTCNGFKTKRRATESSWERKRRWREGIPCVSSFAARWSLGLTPMPMPSLVLCKIPMTVRSSSWTGLRMLTECYCNVCKE